jgi:hypothetical protein
VIGRLVIALIALNLLWAVWSLGWFGLGSQPQTEPERLARQRNAEAVRIQPWKDEPASAAPAPAAPAVVVTAPAMPEPRRAAASEPATPPASTIAAAQASSAAQAAPSVCLQAGTFDDKQIEAVRRAVAELPTVSWRIDTLVQPGRWMVYIGKLADDDAVRAKKAELRALGVDAEYPGVALEPGLVLGRFANEEAAHNALADLTRRGVRIARVVQERPDSRTYMLRLPRANDALRQRLRSLRVLAGKDLRPCE